jgi:5-formyltetrahydrofolate cyclo-ligase
METEQLQQDKTALRERFAAYRVGLSATEYRRRSGRVVQRLAALPEIRQAQVVHCYWPLAERGEIDTRPLVRALHAEGRTVALPVVESFAEDGRPAMTARHYAGPGSLRENRWGLAEPAGTEAVPPSALEAVAVPAFGAGRAEGHRIGHGQGFYDAFLAEVDAPALCPVYDACVAGRVPAEPHDVPMDALVTETETVRP